MFDIGFWELAVIGVVALLVIGPEKLPAVARTVGFWIGKGRRFVATVQNDFQRELSKTEELKRLLEEQSKIKEFHEIIEQTADETRKSVSVGAPLEKPKTTAGKLSTEPAEKPATKDSAIDSASDSVNDSVNKSANASQTSGSGTGSDSGANKGSNTTPTDQVNEQTK